MPYSKEHKERTRTRIVEAARVLFNRHGFERVTIDQIMAHAGLTRGGFYSHFDDKPTLFAEAVSSFLHGRGAVWRAEAGVRPTQGEAEMARRMVDSYLSGAHLEDTDGQCPMIALSSDVARQDLAVRESYQDLLKAMVALFEANLTGRVEEPRKNALKLAALCVGGMILARTLPGSALAEDVRVAAHEAALDQCQ